MKNIETRLFLLAFACCACLTIACGHKTGTGDAPQFVSVRDGKFYIGDSLYRFVGANFWYGPILGSQGRGGDRERLDRELNTLHEHGIDNLRILVGGDGDENLPSHIMPVLQTAPGVYNDTILDGLDYLMAELEKRDMKAVLYLNNSWEWSGGFGTYLEWAGMGTAPNPTLDGYDKFTDYVAAFAHNDSAKDMAANHVKYIVTRTNRYTGQPYAQSPAIMAWQIANEPRPFADDSTTKARFAQWIAEQAALIKSLDANHLVSTGSEGRFGCEYDLDLWADIHKDPNIDYALLHIWPYNWKWVRPDNLVADVDSACIYAQDYLNQHARLMSDIGKPLVLEEFGYPRDDMATTPGTPTRGRDAFYSYILTQVGPDGPLQGCNFWAWGGAAIPPHPTWQTWDPYTGDPAQEPQGLNSVFATDTTTLQIIRNAVGKLY